MSTKLRPGTAEEAGMSGQRVQHIVDLAKGWVAEGITPSLVVLVAHKGVVVIHEAFGHLTPEEDSPPLKLDTIFPLSSLTKPITATAAMILVEDGLLGLNRPVQWYVPEFTGEGKQAVMVHHLLTHTSGLRDEELDAHAQKRGATVEILPPEETQHQRVHEYVRLRYEAPLWKPPGTEMSYCGYGYELLGETVRRVSGRSLASFAKERIFDPLGMKDTYFIVPDALRHRVVKRSTEAFGAELLAAGKVVETPWARTGAFSTTMDMAIFGQMFLNRGTYGGARILSSASVAEMTRNQIPGISAWWAGEFFPEASWGLGWSVRGSKTNLNYGETLQSREAFAHTGGGGVFLWVDPIHEIVGIYFSVATRAGVPVGVVVSEWLRLRHGLVQRVDLFINAGTAAVED